MLTGNDFYFAPQDSIGVCSEKFLESALSVFTATVTFGFVADLIPFGSIYTPESVPSVIAVKDKVIAVSGVYLLHGDFEDFPFEKFSLKAHQQEQEEQKQGKTAQKKDPMQSVTFGARQCHGLEFIVNATFCQASRAPP